MNTGRTSRLPAAMFIPFYALPLRLRAVVFSLVLVMTGGLQAQTVNSLQVLDRGNQNTSTYLIAADAVDGVAETNRHGVRCSSSVTFPAAGTYRLHYQLLNAADEKVAEFIKNLGSLTAGQTVADTAEITQFPTRLSSQSLLRLRVQVARREPTGGQPPFDFVWLPQTSDVEATGRTYFHFPSTNPSDSARNVIADMTGATLAVRRWLVDTVSGAEHVHAAGGLRLIRYDGWESAVNPAGEVAVKLRLELCRASDNAVVMLENEQGQPVSYMEKDYSLTVAPWVVQNGIKVPATATLVDASLLDLRLNPADWLDYDEEYYVRLTAVHEETPGQPWVDGEFFETARSLFYHFNGRLLFGDINTEFTALNGSVTVQNSAGPTLSLPVAAGAGYITGTPTWTYGNGAGLTVDLKPGGTAVYGGASAVDVQGPVAERKLLNGVQYTRESLILGQNGLRGQVSVWLPAGCGYTGTLQGNVLMNRLGPTPGTALNQELEPTAPLAFSGSPKFFVHEETKPFKIEASQISWNPALGRFSLSGAVVHSLRRSLMDALQTVPGLANELKTKSSNDSYWNEAETINTAPYIQAGPTGAAQLYATVGLRNGRTFATHFPRGTSISYGTGSVQIQADALVPSTSTLEGVAGVTVPYGRHCTEVQEACPGAGESLAYYRINPDSSRLRFTPDGGLHGSGATAFSHLVSWGMLNDTAPAAHAAVTPFERGNFLMSGHFLPATLLPFHFGLTSAYIHLRGVSPANLTQSELPGSVAYQDGSGDYAGMNLRASGGDSGTSFRSRLGGSLSEDYSLTPNSKFYLRYGGVSGVQQAPGGLASATGTLMGYQVTFSSFGLGWLSNENVVSRTDGLLVVQAPADFTLPFDDLQFTCLGAPTHSRVAGGSFQEDLLYWNAPFQALGIEFVQEGICDPAAGYLTVAMSLAAKNVSAPLVGSAGFMPDGQIIRPADHRAEIRSEFPLPAVLKVDGPKRNSDSPAETYSFTPTRPAYLNHEAADTRPSGADRMGFWNLVGLMDVPFFEDLRVHAHTSANPAEPLAALHVTGGWGNLFTEREFDGAHAGFTGASPAAYRSGEIHRTRARQHWLGLLQFDYPLQWNSARRTFKSPTAVKRPLLILEAEHRVDYLSPRQTEISFGVEYTGLPRISISNALTNVVDENLGVAASIARSAGDQVLAGIESGVGGFSDLLADRMDALVKEALDGVIEPGLDAFASQVRLAAAEAVAGQQDVRLAVKAVVDAYLRPTGNAEAAAAPVGAPLVPVAVPLSSLFGDVSAPAGLVPSLNLRLGGIETSIHAFAGDAGQVGNPLPGAGVLGRDAFGSRAVLDSLVQNLVGDLAPQFATVIQAAPRFTFIHEAESTLAQIQAAFGDIRKSVSGLRRQLDADLPDHAFLDQFNDLQAQLDLDLETLVLNAVADAVQAYLDEVLAQAACTYPAQADLNAYLDRLREDLKIRVRQELLSRVMTTPAIRGVQTALRARLQGVHLAYREAVDAAFEEVNQIIRRALASHLTGLDDAVSGFGEGLADVLKTGRVTGHAHIQEDALRELRLDARIEMGIPDDNPMRFDGFVRFQQMNSVGPGGGVDVGSPPPVSAGEVTLGARGAALEWLTPGVKADVEATVGFYVPGDVPVPISFGGKFETLGSMGFGGAEVTDVKGTVKVGLAPTGPGGALRPGENYVGLAGAVRLSGSGLEGCIFLGKAATLEPIEFLNPQLGDVLGQGAFTGGYVFGAGRIPIVDFGCLLNLSAGVGAGIFYAAEGPTWGGQMHMSASGEALCVISVRGDVDLIGVKRGDDFRFSGQGRIRGKVGVCPLCKRFNKTVRFTYQGGSWDADY